MDSLISTTNLIQTKPVALKVSDILRGLGLNNKYLGTKLIIKVVKLTISLDEDEFYYIEDIYKRIAEENEDYSPNQIRNAINNALYKRNKELSKKNFEKYFNVDYDDNFFKNSRFIEEISRVVKMTFI